jgi:hypothetical protein
MAGMSKSTDTAENPTSFLILSGRPTFEYRVDADGLEWVREVVDGKGYGGWAALSFPPN